MNIDKEISDFLRDAQWKLAKLTFEMDALEDDGDPYYQELKIQRWELGEFYNILLETQQQMEGGFNWLYTAGWTDKDIINEIHYLRNKNQMNGVPVLNYQHVVHQVISLVQESGSGGSGLPTSNEAGNILVSTANGGWEETFLSDYVGMLNSESLNTYFAGR
jgi:hypothetical protein